MSFGENDGTSRTPDRRVVGRQITQQIVMVQFKNKYGLCNRLQIWARISPIRQHFLRGTAYGFCIFYLAKAEDSDRCALSKWVNNSQNGPAGEGEPDSSVLICKMGAAAIPFTDVDAGEGGIK